MKNRKYTICRGRHLGAGLIMLGLALISNACQSSRGSKVSDADWEGIRMERINYAEVATAFPEDRSTVDSAEAVRQANRAWIGQSTDSADYLHAARHLAASLNTGEYRTAEDLMRQSVIAMQIAHLARDTKTLREAVGYWEAAYPEIRMAPRKGEVDTYLLTIALLGLDPAWPDLIEIADPDVAAVIQSIQ